MSRQKKTAGMRGWTEQVECVCGHKEFEIVYEPKPTNPFGEDGPNKFYHSAFFICTKCGGGAKTFITPDSAIWMKNVRQNPSEYEPPKPMPSETIEQYRKRIQ